MSSIVDERTTTTAVSVVGGVVAGIGSLMPWAVAVTAPAADLSREPVTRLGSPNVLAAALAAVILIGAIAGLTNSALVFSAGATSAALLLVLYGCYELNQVNDVVGRTSFLTTTPGLALVVIGAVTATLSSTAAILV